MKSELEGLASIGLPVSLEPLRGKYYGTHILDANGDEVIELWTAEGAPSQREKENFGPDWSPQQWNEYCCDSHWECEADYQMALLLIDVLNNAIIPTHKKIAAVSHLVCNVGRRRLRVEDGRLVLA